MTLFSFTNTLLVSLTIYRSTASNLLHIAGVRSHYSYALAVFLGEIIKVVLCYAVAFRDFKKEFEEEENESLLATSSSSTSSSPTLYEEGEDEQEGKFMLEFESKRGVQFPFLKNAKSIRSSKRVWRETFNKNAWELLIPASLYVVQNNLCLFAAERLLPSIYQSIWQIRLLPTALLTGLFLKRWPNTPRWFCLFGIAMGVIVMESAELSSPNSQKSSISTTEIVNKGVLLGSSALLTASFCSATSVVVLERIFKNEKTNFWVTNLQLSVFSLIPAFVLVVFELWRSDGTTFPGKAFINSFWPWIAIFVQTGSGILAGLVTKYADGVTNSMSGVVSIALTALIDQIMREQKVELMYRLMVLIGVLAIISCTWLYSFFPLDKQEHSSLTSFRPILNYSPLSLKDEFKRRFS